MTNRKTKKNAECECADRVHTTGKENRSEIPRISEAALKASCGYLLQPEVVDQPDEHGDRSMGEPLPPGCDRRFQYRVWNSLGAYKDYSGGR
jgi:hypothetical protein